MPDLMAHFAGTGLLEHFAATDWDEFHAKIPEEIHRGLYAPESHGVFTTPMSDEDIAHGLIAAHQEEHFPYEPDRHRLFGTHWTSDEGVARGFAHEHERAHFEEDDQCPGHDEHSEATPVVFHAQRPQRHEIENDPRRLGWQNVDDYTDPEHEVPIRHGAPVRITGVSWLKHTGLGPLWHRHDLREPVELRAEDRDSPSNPNEWNASLHIAAWHPGPHYHGTPAELEPGALIEPGKYPPTTPDPDVRGEQANQPREHVYFAPRRNYITEHYGPNVYEVEPEGEYKHDPEYGYSGGSRYMYRSKQPLRVKRKVSTEWGLPHEGLLAHFAAAANPPCFHCGEPLDDEDVGNEQSAHEECEQMRECPVHGEHDDPVLAEQHRDTYTDWSMHLPFHGGIHRGFPKQLPADVHALVHDSSRPVAGRAHVLRNYLHREGFHGGTQEDVPYGTFTEGHLGVHWSPSETMAKSWGTEDYDEGPHGGGPKPSVTHIVLHAKSPDYSHIEHDPDHLEARHMYGFDHERSEHEVPLKFGAPVHLTGISWKQGGTEDWNHYGFRRPEQHLAAAGDPAVPEAFPNPYHGTSEFGGNPEFSHTWFHGTRGTDPDLRPGRPLEDQRGGESGRGWPQPNKLLGTHLSPLHKVAHGFAKGVYPSKVGGGSPGVGSALVHTRLHFRDPAHYPTEGHLNIAIARFAHDHSPDWHDDKLNQNMAWQYSDTEGTHRNWHAEPHYDPNGTYAGNRDFRRLAEQAQRTLQWHPKLPSILHDFTDDLIRRGHHGITYGNEVEGPGQGGYEGEYDKEFADHTTQDVRHISAIATRPSQIETTRVEHIAPPKTAPAAHEIEHHPTEPRYWDEDENYAHGAHGYSSDLNEDKPMYDRIGHFHAGHGGAYPGRRTVHTAATGDYRYEHLQPESGRVHWVNAYHRDGHRVGDMTWHAHGDHMITWIAVYDEGDRRKGVATGMWNKAREVDPQVSHNTSEGGQTDAGHAWAQTTAGLAMPSEYGEDNTAPPEGEIHRGVSFETAHYHPETHRILHDDSIPVADRAAHLMGHLHDRLEKDKWGGGGVGQHWSTSEKTARGFATQHENPADQPWSGLPKDLGFTRVVFHAAPPKQSHMITSPRTKMRRDILPTTHGEREVPLRNRAPVTLTGVSWSRNEKDAAWTRHDFDQPIRVKASASIIDNDEAVKARLGRAWPGGVRIGLARQSSSGGDFTERTGSSNGDRHVTCAKGHVHWGAYGAAGLLIRHKGEDDKTRYLLQKRSPYVNEPNTWSVPGGAIGKRESPEDGAWREAREELGSIPRHVTTHHTVTSTDCGDWKYHTVVADAKEHFMPRGGGSTDYETAGVGWHTAGEIDDLDKSGDLHPGFAKSWDAVRRSRGPKTAAADGDLVDIYHHTYPESARSIWQQKHFEPADEENRVYGTNLPPGTTKGQTGAEYGTAAVHLRVPRGLVTQWPGPPDEREHYYDIDADDIRPEHFVKTIGAGLEHEAAASAYRLWRGEGSHGEAPVSEGSKGRWFTPDRVMAEDYAYQHRGHLYRLDVSARDKPHIAHPQSVWKGITGGGSVAVLADEELAARKEHHAEGCPSCDPEHDETHRHQREWLESQGSRTAAAEPAMVP